MNTNLKLSNYAILTIIVVYLSSMILSNMIKKIGINIVGFDYFLYLLLSIPIIFAAPSVRISKKYLFATISIVFICIISAIASKYVVSSILFLIGFILTLLPIYTYIVFSNIYLKFVQIIKLLRLLQIINTTIIIIFLIYCLINLSVLDLHNVGFLKDVGIVATSFSINIVISLFLFNYNRRKTHIYIALLSFVAIIAIVSLKTIISSFVVVVLYYLIFSNKINLKSILIGAFISLALVSVAFSSSSIRNKILLYTDYYGPDKIENVGRGISYIGAYRIAKDHFPLGSAPSTFGSFPVNIVYNNVYEEYGMSLVYGMKNPKESGNTEPNFLLDTYWSSPLGELGFIGFAIYLYLFFFPILKIVKSDVSDSNLKIRKRYLFYITATGVVIFFESIALSIYSQISYILLYTGVSAIMINSIWSDTKKQ